MHAIIQAIILRIITTHPLTVALYTPTFGRLTLRDMRRRSHLQPLIVGDTGHAEISGQASSWHFYSFESLVTQHQMTDPYLFFWRNHLLDLYFHYVPLGQPQEELFELLVQALRLHKAPPIACKLFIVHFFKLLGCHMPEGFDQYTQTLESLIFEPEAKTYTYLCEEKLDQWLSSMIVQHDHFQYLKTQQFMPQLYSSMK